MQIKRLLTHVRGSPSLWSLTGEPKPQSSKTLRPQRLQLDLPYTRRCHRCHCPQAHRPRPPWPPQHRPCSSSPSGRMHSSASELSCNRSALSPT